ncbi:MAG: hypothetical protein SVR08_15555 [Spirochaetota bacterium]|nr:hypothetical protein [Spirochaetota bacterium]
MNRVFLILIILFIFISASQANIYIDINGALTQTVDAENQIGGGGAVLYDIHRDINVFFKTIINTRILHYNSNDQVQYEYYMNLAGMEYQYNINNIPLFWKFSIAMGFGNVNIDFKDNTKEDSNDSGFCMAAWTGLKYVVTQHLCPFIDIGIHKSLFTKELKNSNIMGAQILVGLRITVYGKNRSILSDY